MADRAARGRLGRRGVRTPARVPSTRSSPCGTVPATRTPDGSQPTNGRAWHAPDLAPNRVNVYPRRHGEGQHAPPAPPRRRDRLRRGGPDHPSPHARPARGPVRGDRALRREPDRPARRRGRLGHRSARRGLPCHGGPGRRGRRACRQPRRLPRGGGARRDRGRQGRARREADVPRAARVRRDRRRRGVGRRDRPGRLHAPPRARDGRREGGARRPRRDPLRPRARLHRREPAHHRADIPRHPRRRRPRRPRRGGGRAPEALIAEAIGPVPPTVGGVYGLLLGLGSHDISAMRELLGNPAGVAYATARHGGQYASAVIDYGSYVCQYETGVDDIPRFDPHLEVFGTARVLRVQYDTPYVRNLPIRLSVTAANGRGGVEVHTEHPEWGDAFTAEWLPLHDSIARRAEPSASPADFRRDLELFADMVELMAAADPVAS